MTYEGNSQGDIFDSPESIASLYSGYNVFKWDIRKLSVFLLKKTLIFKKKLGLGVYFCDFLKVSDKCIEILQQVHVQTKMREKN